MNTFKQYIKREEILLSDDFKEDLYKNVIDPVSTVLEPVGRKALELKKIPVIKWLAGDAESIPGKIAATAWGVS